MVAHFAIHYKNTRNTANVDGSSMIERTLLIVRRGGGGLKMFTLIEGPKFPGSG